MNRPLRESATREDAERAKNTLSMHLARVGTPPSWLRGIGLGQNRCIGDCQPFTLEVRVAREDDRIHVPSSWEGFPVRAIAVGDVQALGQPTSPWWALWVNLGGVGDWQFVAWLYIADQDLAPGNPKAVVDRVIQGLADQLTSPTVGQNAGDAEMSTARPSALAGPPNLEWI